MGLREPEHQVSDDEDEDTGISPFDSEDDIAQRHAVNEVARIKQTYSLTYSKAKAGCKTDEDGWCICDTELLPLPLPPSDR